MIALGEGLETQCWRVDNGRARWVTVDLPESVALRAQLLARNQRQHAIDASALDTAAWLHEVRGDTLITAHGPPMYLDRDAVPELFAALPPATVLFDVVSKRLAALSAKPRKQGYQPPPWTYAAELASLPLRDLRRVPLAHAGRFWLPRLARLVSTIDVYSARTSAASSSISTTPATTSSASMASAARAAVRASRCDA